MASDQIPTPLGDSAWDPAGLVTIGDYVWIDTDTNGVQAPGEAGIPGAIVELHNSSGDVLATATTDNVGGYLFPGVQQAATPSW